MPFFCKMLKMKWPEFRYRLYLKWWWTSCTTVTIAICDFPCLLRINKVNGEANRDCHKSFESISPPTVTPSLLPSLAHTDTLFPSPLPPLLTCTHMYLPLLAYTYCTSAFLPRPPWAHTCACAHFLYESLKDSDMHILHRKITRRTEWLASARIFSHVHSSKAIHFTVLWFYLLLHCCNI